MSASVTAFDRLKSELEKDRPDFEKVQQIISANKDLLNKPISDDGKYVLHYACGKNAPSNIVIEFIKGNALAVQQKSNCGYYPLHLACKKNQSSVIQLLVKEYPLALQEKTDYYGYYPLHLACRFNHSKSVIQLLVNKYPLAVQQKTRIGDYPLHFAIRKEQSENIILKLVYMFPQAAMEYCTFYDACRHIKSERLFLLLINLSLHTVKYLKITNSTLAIAKRNQSSTIIKVLEQLMTLSDSDLENRIGIPKIVTLHALDNLRRHDTCQWLLKNSPILIDGKYVFRLSKKRK